MLAWLVWPLLALGAYAEEPLHTRLDRLIADKAGGELAPPADDATFVRRIYLDLVGRIPSRDETRAFLDDTAADKRAKLIDQLLASPEHPQHMARVFDVMLMERLGTHEAWRSWLQQSFADNRPWDQMTREMLAPHVDESDPAYAAGFFVAKRLENYGENPVDYPGLVRDVGRLLLGVDLQCAQCHDHPQIDDYKQVDYQGLYAYFANVSLRRNAKVPAVDEKPTTMKIAFQSVFVDGKHEVGPRLPFGMETMIPVVVKGEEYESPPDPKAGRPGVLKFSPLRVLSAELPRAETPGFSKNIVNRLWWQLLGRGLVHPLDQHHRDNPPSHPEVLTLLADEFVAHGYDMRWMLRELALSATYQRSSEIAAGESTPPEAYRTALEKGLSPEQMARSLWTATGPWPDDKGLAELETRAVKALAQPPREPETEFAPSVKGALFLSHDAKVLELLQRRDGNLIDRLNKLESAGDAVDEALLSVLSRPAAPDEREELSTWLEKSADRESALRQLVWALLASNEFALNH